MLTKKFWFLINSLINIFVYYLNASRLFQTWQLQILKFLNLRLDASGLQVLYVTFPCYLLFSSFKNFKTSKTPSNWDSHLTCKVWGILDNAHSSYNNFQFHGKKHKMVATPQTHPSTKKSSEHVFITTVLRLHRPNLKLVWLILSEKFIEIQHVEMAQNLQKLQNTIVHKSAIDYGV